MTRSFWRRLEVAFNQVANLNARQRAAIVRDLSAKDIELAQALSELLRYDSASDAPLLAPVERELAALLQHEKPTHNAGVTCPDNPAGKPR